MTITEALIARFFRGEGNEQERQAVKFYLMEHPEVLQQYLTDESWDTFATSSLLPEEVSGKMLHVIRQHAQHKRRVLYIRYGWAAAVMLLLSLGALTYYMQVRQPAVKVAKQNSAIKDSLPDYKEQLNATAQTLSFSLSDGSRVELASHSAIRYAMPFGLYNRDIHLKGKATFHVAQNSNRPFTVYAGKLATTALGTVFTITAFNEDKDIVSVRLLSGKVVVHPDRALQGQGLRSTYLAPGQELRFNPLLRSIAVNNVHALNRLPANIAVKRHAADTAGIAMLAFHDEPLDAIFNTLSDRYHTRIVFMQSTLDGMRFTGRFDSEKESLMDFITTIGLLNNLKVYQKGETIYIEGQ